MTIFDKNYVRGGMEASKDGLCGTEEFPTVGVGFCAAHHAGHRDSVPSCGDALREAFLPAQFKWATFQIPRGEVTAMLVNQDDIALPEHTQTAGANWVTSCVIKVHLVAVLHRTAEFRSGYDDLLMGEIRDEILRRIAEDAEMALEESQASESTEDTRRMGKIMRTGVWMSVLPSTVNGTELGAQKWRYSLYQRYGIDTPDLT